MIYARPLAQSGPVRPRDALSLAGGWAWFTHAEILERGGSRGIVAAAELPVDLLERLTWHRVPVAGVTMCRPSLMGILNVTPDSFSDGGQFDGAEAATAAARGMAATVQFIDVGGESTRPGAAEVPEAEEIARTAPVIAALAGGMVGRALSIDTRKAGVAQAALDAGAALVNDVSALCHDPALGPLVALSGAALCLMHAQGAPETMQDDPRYEDVLLDVYDALSERVTHAEALGIERTRIVIDPGIGFGKTLGHNLTLLNGLSLFHGLGCPILLGASRKRFIGTIGAAPDPADRGPGTNAVMLAGVAQGVQIHRVHDTAGAAQALALWRAVENGTMG